MTTMSDEVKLFAIKQELNNVMVAIKTLIATCSHIEPMRMLIAGELPDEYKEYVDSKDYKEGYVLASNAQTESLANLIHSIGNICEMYGIDFISQIPTNADELKDMTIELGNHFNIDIGN
jgi:hypothetical protein